MKTFIVGILCCSLALAGDCRVVQQQIVYPNALAVAAAPLTAGYIVDLQAYQYRVNPSFQSYPEYQAKKPNYSAKSNGSISEADQQAIAEKLFTLMKQKGIVTESPDTNPDILSGSAPVPADLLKGKCFRCHNQVDPQGVDDGFIMFDERNELLTSLPWAKIQKRVNSHDPNFRMPPNGLASDELVEVNAFLKGKVPLKVSK